MIRAEIELGGQLEVVLIEAESKSKAIEKIWNTCLTYSNFTNLDD